MLSCKAFQNRYKCPNNITCIIRCFYLCVWGGGPKAQPPSIEGKYPFKVNISPEINV